MGETDRWDEMENGIEKERQRRLCAIGTTQTARLYTWFDDHRPSIIQPRSTGRLGGRARY